MSWLFHRRAEEIDRMKEFGQRIEEIGEGLEGSIKELKNTLAELENEVRKVGKVQFKGNNLIELNQQTTEEALNTLKRAIDQRDREFLAFQHEAEARLKRETLLFTLEDLFAIDGGLKECIAMMKKDEAEGGGGGIWVTGLKGIHERVVRVLKALDVEPIPTKGHPFDPNLHVAIDVIETDEVPANTIVTEYIGGYMMEGRVLRPAQVGVARPPQKEAEVPVGREEEPEGDWRRESRRWRHHRRLAWAKLRSKFRNMRRNRKV